MKHLSSQRLWVWQLLYLEFDMLERGRSVLASCRCNGTGWSVSKHPRSTNFLQQGCTNLGQYVAVATEYFTVATDILRFWIWNVLHVKIPASRILKCLLRVWKICALLWIPHGWVNIPADSSVHGSTITRLLQNVIYL